MRPFYPNLDHSFRVGNDELARGYLTGLSDANNIAVLQTNWYGLSLNGRWFLVTDLINDPEDLWRNRRLVPRSEGMGDRAACPSIRICRMRDKFKRAHLEQQC